MSTAQLEGLLAAFNTQLAGQQRLVTRYGAVSPAIVAYEGLTAWPARASAGTCISSGRSMTSIARGAILRPEDLNGIAYRAADLDRIPAFVWTRGRSGGRAEPASTGVLQLLIPAAALAALGVWRLRRTRL